jgi:hypothetical protein
LLYPIRTKSKCYITNTYNEKKSYQEIMLNVWALVENYLHTIFPA